jgi:hypothetical protein
MSREPKIIYSADNPQQAYLLRSLLENEGIQAWVLNDAIQIAGGELPVGWRGAAKVAVGDDDAAAAREFAEAFDHQAQRHFFEPQDNGENDEPDNSLPPPPVWPVCPTCGQPQSARCPICGESGAHFSSADGPFATHDDQQLFLCPSCDDAITPEWYRLCARCGHDFGTGLQIQQPPPARIELSLRIVIALAALLSLTVAVVGYFIWLFARHP